MYKSEKNKLYFFWIYIFIGSFLAGILTMNLWGEGLLSEDGVFCLTTINRMKYITIDGNKFLPFILKSRVKEYLLLVLLSTTGIGIMAVYLHIVWTGFLCGMFLTATAIRFGLKGILLFIAGILPHQLLLFPAGFMLLSWCYENCCHMCYPVKKNVFICRNKKDYIVRQGIILSWIFIVFVIGCILESYVNPILICELVKIF